MPRSPLPQRHGLESAWVRTPDHGQCRRLSHDRGIVNRWPWPTLRDFLVEKLTRITPSRIDEMITEKKFVTQDGVPITAMTTFEPQCFIFFHRDLPDEKSVPFPIGILYQDERILVVDKPHFLSSIPRGQHVLESVVVKLRTQFQMPELTVAHRLDRVTSGVLMLTCARQWRCPYQTLFERRQVRKTYRLVAPWLDLGEMGDGPLGVIGDSPSGSAHGFGRLGEDETATSPDVAVPRDGSVAVFGENTPAGGAISVTSQDHREQECSSGSGDDLFGQGTKEPNRVGQHVATKSNGLPHKDGDQSLTSGQRCDPSDQRDRAISVTSSQSEAVQWRKGSGGDNFCQSPMRSSGAGHDNIVDQVESRHRTSIADSQEKSRSGRFSSAVRSDTENLSSGPVWLEHCDGGVRVSSHIIKERGVLQAQQVGGREPNAVTEIRVVERRGDLALYEATPLTGRTHQIRLHMWSLGAPILNDPFYPQLLDVPIDDFSRPLQLQAYRMSFVDPITGERRVFTSQLELSCWPSKEAGQSWGEDRGNA